MVSIPLFLFSVLLEVQFCLVQYSAVNVGAGQAM